MNLKERLRTIKVKSALYVGTITGLLCGLVGVVTDKYTLMEALAWAIFGFVVIWVFFVSEALLGKWKDLANRASMFLLMLYFWSGDLFGDALPKAFRVEPILSSPHLWWVLGLITIAFIANVYLTVKVIKDVRAKDRA